MKPAVTDLPETNIIGCETMKSDVLISIEEKRFEKKRGQMIASAIVSVGEEDQKKTGTLKYNENGCELTIDDYEDGFCVLAETDIGVVCLIINPSAYVPIAKIISDYSDRLSRTLMGEDDEK